MFTTQVVLPEALLLATAVLALGTWWWCEFVKAKRQRQNGCLQRCQAATMGRGNEPGERMSDKLNIEPLTTSGEERRRLRALGVSPGTLPCGRNNAITDAGVLVGHTTLISGDGKLVAGQGPVRTGVTVILPHSGDLWNARASAGSFVLNGNGSMTGLDWIQECGLLEGPIALTNTHSVGDVYSGMIRWMMDRHPQIGIEEDTYLPVVGECDDSPLNDIRGMHVRHEHVVAALNSAQGGAVAEGTVGGGTGMSCYDFKGGIGTASRLVEIAGRHYTVGVLVNCNHGDREQLKVLGVPVGQALVDADRASKHVEGSICIVVATDAPLSGRQLNRIAKRAAMGLALTGASANNASGDFIVAFSNGRLVPRDDTAVRTLPELSDDFISPLFDATIEATEEAILNALCMATTVVGRDGNVSPAIPLDRLQEILRQHGRVR